MARKTTRNCPNIRSKRLGGGAGFSVVLCIDKLSSVFFPVFARHLKHDLSCPYLFLLLALSGVPLRAQDVTIFEPDSVKRVLTPLRITREVRLDGRLDEAEWQQARPATDFLQIEPFQRQPSQFRTEVRMMHSARFVYFGVFCGDSLGRRALRVPSLRRDFEYGGRDLISISIDGFYDQRNAASFVTDPYGTQRDLLSFDDAIYDVDWDGLWRVRTTRTDSGWFAELAIPWQTLRYQRSTGPQTWGINFSRNRRASNELSAWSPVPRAYSAVRMNYAGLTRIEPPPTTLTNIRLQPYLLLAQDRYRGTEPLGTNASSLKLGGEVKWAFNANTVLDLTVNTDFAQADADRQVNNLTRFSVFFPERRAFFLENAGLFGVGLQPLSDFWGGQMIVQPFFSRRIGLDDFGNPIPIDAGARLVTRSARRNAGAILMRQRAFGDNPATNYFVGRFSENIGSQHRIGGLMTVKNSAEQTNTTASVDGFFRFSPALSLRTMAMASANADGTGRGLSGYYQWYYSSNQWSFWLNQAAVTREFTPDVGFVSRTDVIETTPGGYWLGRGKWLPRWIRAFEPGAYYLVYHQASTGRRIEQTIQLNPVWFNFQNGGAFGYFFFDNYQRLDSRFEPLGIQIAPGEYRYGRQFVVLTGDPSRKLNGQINYEWGGYYDGRLGTMNAALFYSPLPHISLTFLYQQNRFRDVGLARTNARVDLFSVQSRLALNPRVQLIGFYQRNSLGNRDLWNVRFSWEYRPLSFLYVVFNERGYDGLDRSRQHAQQVIGKLSYLKQF
jgi:hypothetical protein